MDYDLDHIIVGEDNRLARMLQLNHKFAVARLQPMKRRVRHLVSGTLVTIPPATK